ncbi:VacJ family lipoprotein [Janthinobacterium fluminis]|nr:VacJ family lipoprotein [Janthinobacterium fluminis]
MTVSGLRSLGLAVAAAAALSGCATSGNPRDPLEGFNRAMFKFNDTVDQAALKPAATVYKSVLPSFVQTGVGNFFGNLADVWSAANNLMQGKGEAGMSDFTRVMLNSSFGILGLLDIASEAGLPKHSEDFGQTLGYWGVKSGPYLMLPLLGPSTLRDTAGLPLDIMADPWRYKEPNYLRNIGIATRVVDKRAYLLDASNLMEEAALDRYEFVRDSFLQLRESKVFDGEGNPRTRKNAKQAAVEAPEPIADAAAPLSSEALPEELTTDTPAEHNAGL